MKKLRAKEHFYVSRSGSIFALTKLGDSWYLIGMPIKRESIMLWPIAAAVSFKTVHNYVKNQLGFSELR